MGPLQDDPLIPIIDKSLAADIQDGGRQTGCTSDSKAEGDISSVLKKP